MWFGGLVGLISSVDIAVPDFEAINAWSATRIYLSLLSGFPLK